MNWNPVENGLPPMPPHAQDPCTETVWVYTDWEYAGRYGIGWFDYEDPGWCIFGCQGNVTHWAALEPPQKISG
jgi:hypothetical protein